MPKMLEKKLIEEFKDRSSFTREELFEFFRYFEPDLKESTFGWRIYDLKNKDIVKSLMRGLYVISYKPKYSPEISPPLFKVANIIGKQFESINYCLWETNWLNEFSQHQSNKQMIIVEIEKEFMESLYYDLKDSLKSDVYLNPDEHTINYYISESNHPIIIKKLLTRSPIRKRTEKRLKLHIPQLEKILVDLFAEERLFYLYQGAELVHIFENVIKSYSIDYTKLFSYAKRRERDESIKEFLTNSIPHLVKDIIDD